MKIIGVIKSKENNLNLIEISNHFKEEVIKLGHSIKLEVHGESIIEELKIDDINNSDVVIIAADTDVDMSRFVDKNVKVVSINQISNDSKNLIDGIIETITSESISEEVKEKRGIIDHFTAGVDMMLPFVIAGGIIIALSFVFGINASDPASADYNVIAGALKTIGSEVAFSMMVPALAAGISVSIAGKYGFAPGIVAGLLATVGGSGFLGGLVGGIIAGYIAYFLAEKVKVKDNLVTIYQMVVVPLISIIVIGLLMVFVIDVPISWLLETLTAWLNGLSDTSGFLFGVIIGVMISADMGGPINKTISTFAIGLMASGVNGPIAACMAAGMTPPLGLALATVLFKNKFTDEEKVSGQTAWILGASYITEGAIPFAIADPVRVIPSIIVGAAVSAGASMGFGITSLAPHGGVFVLLIPNVISNVPLYVLSITLGVVVTALMVGFLKKPINN